MLTTKYNLVGILARRKRVIIITKEALSVLTYRHYNRSIVMPKSIVLLTLGP